MPTIDKFSAYLLAALPTEYPISSIPLSLKMEDAHRKELVFQQAKFLEEAEALTENKPWLSFIAAIKHLLLLEFYKTDTTTFREISDKEYFDRVQTKAQKILGATKELDQETKDNCSRLVAIQLFYTNIQKALDAVRKALSLGFYLFDPPINEPKRSTYIQALFIGVCLLIFITFWTCVYVNENIPSMSGILDKFTGIALVELIIGVGAGGWVIIPLWKKDDDKWNTYETFRTLREDYYFNAKAFASAFDFDATEMAKNLKLCAERLEAIIQKRKILADHYIVPYV